MENDASLSGWSSIDAVKYVGFTERILSDLEVIIQNFYNLPKTQAILKFHEDLQLHLVRSTGAHDLDISPWHDRLIKQLYRTYRLAGFSGSVEDMLVSIAKVIDIATHADITAGYSTQKAVDVTGWRWLFNKHSTSRTSHQTRFDLLQPGQFLNAYPGFTFGHFFKDNFAAYTDGYSIDSWNDREGTLFIDFHYDFSAPDSPIATSDILSLVFETHMFIIRYSVTIGHGLNCLGIYKEIATGIETKLFQMALPFASIGYEPLLLTYAEGILTARDLLSKVSFDCPFIGSPSELRISLPLSDTGTALKEVTYYRVAASPDEQLSFLK